MLFKHVIINETPEDEYKLDHIPETKKVIDWDFVTAFCIASLASFGLVSAFLLS